MPDVELVRSDSPRVSELEATGYRLLGESWGARLRYGPGALGALQLAMSRADVDLTELGPEFAVAVFELETATSADYPETPSSPHRSRDLPAIRALWEDCRLYGALDGNRLVAVAAISRDGERAEVEFASVLSDYRGQGVGAAIVAFAITQEAGRGAAEFRTGGAVGNTASLSTARSIGFVIDERWLTYSR